MTTKRFQTTLKEIYETFYIEDYERISLDEIVNERFENMRRVHDWRNYIDQKEWSNMRDFQKVLLYCQAVILANDEDWE